MHRKGILSSLRNRGLAAWCLAICLLLFYVFLYFGKDLDKNFFWGKTWKNFYQNTYIPQRQALQEEIVSIRNNIKEIKNNEINTTSLYNRNLKELEQKLADKRDSLSILKKKYSILYKSSYSKQNGDYIVQYHKKERVRLTGEFHSTLLALQDKFSAQRFLSYFYKALNPLSQFLRNKPSDRWFLYGFLYTLLVVLMGFRFIRKFKGDKYQKVRTASIMFFQLGLAFILPGLLEAAGTKGFYFTYFWPLKFDYIFPTTLAGLPRAMTIWTIFASFIAVPVLTYFFGKRWYCSWVCGCGALANTMGDPFRHLSDKSEKSLKIEIVTVYGILIITIIATIIIVLNQTGSFSRNMGMQEFAFGVQKWYLFFIVAGFGGLIGTGFYPLAGTRVWCRFGCPQAAILGILQKFFSRFRITTNGDQCMSCGNCSTYCEMGIDVRAYAMEGKDIVRASCVGCGLCMSVCPRGVLKLENGPRLIKNL